LPSTVPTTSTSTPKLLVIVATYNEIDSLPRLVIQIDQRLPEADILVIDDASPDGTGNWCEEVVDKYPQLSVIHRTGKLGLGSATVEGFQWATDRDYDLVATMDADLSHAPQSLFEMHEKMRAVEFEHVGVMIGSRYIHGGGTEGWPLTRRIASKAVNAFARFWLKLKTKDNSGAFRIYRSQALANLDVSSLKSSDYAYLEEILWRLNRDGVQMAEHPIVFRNRELGRSKTSPILGMKVFWQILRMGFETLEQCEKLKAEIEAGGDFKAAAMENSSCPSGLQGGDLGEFGPGQMVPEFDAVVFSAPVNTVQGPVKTQFGYHLLEVTSRED